MTWIIHRILRLTHWAKIIKNLEKILNFYGNSDVMTRYEDEMRKSCKDYDFIELRLLNLNIGLIIVRL